MALRISILQQSAAAAAATGEKQDGDSGGDDDDADENDETRGTSPAAVTARWTALFEGRDRAGTGRAAAEDLRAALEKVKYKKHRKQEQLVVAGDGNGEGWEDRK